MTRWIERQIDYQMDRKIDRLLLLDGQIDRIREINNYNDQIYRQMTRQIERQIDDQMDRKIDRLLD